MIATRYSFIFLLYQTIVFWSLAKLPVPTFVYNIFEDYLIMEEQLKVLWLIQPFDCTLPCVIAFEYINQNFN